jgi:phosphate transport system substrate-binding protein
VPEGRPYVGREPQDYIQEEENSMPKNGMLVKISVALAAVAALATIAATGAGAARQSVTLSGAGSTFIQPMINAWTQLPSPSSSPFTSSKGIGVTYGGGGSGAGITGIKNKTIDFGASDAPTTAFSPTCPAGPTCVQIPWLLSGTAIIYHVNGINATIKMTPQVLAKIYLHQIHYWNDPAIKGLNKTLPLPHVAIETVVRDSASGTTYNFTDELSKASVAFKAKFGAANVLPPWSNVPGPFVAKHGSSGVAGEVAATNGAIGYVDVWYGQTAHLHYMAIQNRAKLFVIPTNATILAAAKVQVHPKPDGTLDIVNPPSSTAYAHAYPFSTYSYVDVQVHSGAKAAPLRTFFKWAITTGQNYATANFFVKIPAPIVTFDTAQIAKIVN